ncbi:MAG: fenitrothion hydrolase [Actinomycetota bacterium]
MRRRTTAVAAATAALVLGVPSPAWAHGIGGRLDLPVPTWLFVYGSATAVIVSFVALAVLWKEPRLEGQATGRPFPGWAQRLLRGPVQDGVVRTVSVAAFLVTLVAAAGGTTSPTGNLAPVLVYVWVWVGLAFAHALFGNWWATLSPWDTIARFLKVGERPWRPYPLAWGKWPAALLLGGFVWMELVYPFGDSPRALAAAIVAYSAITLAGMAVFGRDAWNRGGEAFAVYFGLLSRLAPVTRLPDGRVARRPLLGGLPSLRPQPGLVPFVMVLIGSTGFDGLTGTALWTSLTGSLGPVAGTVAGTAGLVGVILLVSLAYTVAMMGASAVAGTPWHPLSVRFVHSLVPIAFAYVAAHYFSLLVLEGQLGISALSDPLGRGWDVFGTAGLTVNLALLSAAAIWYVQVAAIVAGHVAGVVLAHDKAVAAFRRDLSTRSQYALLAIMVMFTVGGLVILSGR